MGHTGGFAANPERARAAGQKGGKRSLRTMSIERLKSGNIPPSVYDFIKTYVARLPQLFTELLGPNQSDLDEVDADNKLSYYYVIEALIGTDNTMAYLRTKVIASYITYLRERARQQNNHQVLVAVAAIQAMLRDIVKNMQEKGAEINVPTPAIANKFLLEHYEVYQKLG